MKICEPEIGGQGGALRKRKERNSGDHFSREKEGSCIANGRGSLQGGCFFSPLFQEEPVITVQANDAQMTLLVSSSNYTLVLEICFDDCFHHFQQHEKE